MKVSINPFSGIFDKDIPYLIVPQYNIDTIKKILATNNHNVAIELLGKQGRGKTTHLKYYHQKFETHPIFELTKEYHNIKDIINHSSDFVFIDSIHHLSFLERLQLFKSKKTVIYTSHWNRYISAKMVQKPLHVLKFKAINSKILEEITNKRLSFYKNTNSLTKQDINWLIKTYGDNYRSIINHLYTQYNESF